MLRGRRATAATPLLRATQQRAPDDASPTTIDDISDQRTKRVLALLQPAERDVALAYARCDQLDIEPTWVPAAVHCGHTAEVGERVRRKLRHLGQQHASRLQHLRAA